MCESVNLADLPWLEDLMCCKRLNLSSVFIKKKNTYTVCILLSLIKFRILRN